MKFEKIELYNFGSYENKSQFDTYSSDPEKRIVVIGGKNGAGKTTLFTAIQLCLYGNYAFGYKTAGRFYLKEVYNLINNRARLNPEEIAYVKITFSHTESRECIHYEMQRSWSWETGNIVENLCVSQNEIEMDSEELLNFQNYLIHLIPPDLLKLYFFDGEKIADYFLSSSKINIREALMILSGNDTFDILHDNVRRVLNINKNSDTDKTSEYLQLQKQLSDLESHLEALRMCGEQLQNDKSSIEVNLEHLRVQYSSRGGLTLDQWNDLQTELKGEEEKRERINWQRKSIATDILPFIILHKNVDLVLPQIKKEEDYAAFKLLQQKLTDDNFVCAFTTAMKDAGVNSDVKINAVMHSIMSNLLTGNWDDFNALLCLSDDEKIQIHSVLSRVLDYDPKTLGRYQKRLDASLQRSKEIRAKIQTSDIEHIEEFVKETTRLEGEVKVLDAKLEQNESEILAFEQQISLQNQAVAAARKQLEQELKKASVSALSGRVLLLLEDLQHNIYSLLTKEVEADLKYKLNQLMRKNRFFDDIIIDEDFNVHILRKQTVLVDDLVEVVKKGGEQALINNIGEIAFNHLMDGAVDTSNSFVLEILGNIPDAAIELPMELDKERMSSGEKQIFVMSLYWSLMQQSENELPFIIDTPFARIDTEHRANITKHFFLDLCGQLFILSTNEEINDHHLDVMKDQVSHVYMLEYGDDKRTYAYENQYFEV